MGEPVLQDSGYETVFGGTTLQAYQRFSTELKVEIVSVMASLAQNPIQPPATSGPIDPAGEMYIYQQSDPHLQLTYRIDGQASQLVFVHFASSVILKGKKGVVVARSIQAEDNEWFDKVDKFLTQPLEKKGRNDVWDVTHREDGANLAAEIQGRMDAADMALLMVSQSYLNGDGVPPGLDLDSLVQKNMEEGLDIQWIPTRASTWEDHPFLESHTSLREIKEQPHPYLENVPENQLNAELLKIYKKLKKLLED
ncbi:MAG: hypothetical protein GY769_18485 [bacterium]|nr:hypothetical protein [bacterium]